MSNRLFIEADEMIKTAYAWMEAHKENKCTSLQCEEIMEFLKQGRYKDITDQETAELIVVNFPDYIEDLTKQRLEFEKQIKREARELTQNILSSLKPVQKENRLLENVMSLLLSFVIVVLAVFVVIHVYNDNYDQATFNLVLGFISLFFLDIYNR